LRPVFYPAGAAAAKPTFCAKVHLCRSGFAPFGAGIAMLGLPPAGAPCALLNIEREDDMAESVYKVIELIGTSKDSWEKAATAAVNRAGKSLRDLRVAEVVQLDLQLDAKGKIEAYRAKLKVSFKFEG
jgi:flavin-binding protein dodecin